ncbi:MAG TPA: GtrA family protein [Chitinophagaceae bacterium]|nr:GtrA family protein [Chitinophagaceae bacterium]
MINLGTFAPSYMRAFILNIIDFFYFPFFRKWIPLRTFRYLACGGFSTGLDLLVFYLSFHFIVDQQMVHLPFMTISGYIAAYIISFCVSFPVGFALSKYVVFPESRIRGRIQLIRYLLIVGFNILFNYLLLHFFVQICHFYPTISKVIIAIILALFSYFSQRHFTFIIKSGEKGS